MAIGIGIGLQFSRGGGIPFQSDLALNFYERHFADYIEKIGSANVKILPSCGLIDANNYLSKTVSDYNIGDASGYVEARFYYNGTASAIRIFNTAATNSSYRYFFTAIISGKPRIVVRSSTNAFFNIVETTTALSVGWHTVRFGSTGSAYYIIVDGTTQTLASPITGFNDDKWLNLVESRVNISIGILLMPTPSTSDGGYIDYVDYNGKSKWYLSGKGKYEYDTIGSYNMAWTGTAHTVYDENASRYYLDNGWFLFKKTGEVDEQVPISATITDIEALGYSKPDYGSFASSLKGINMANCYIDFSATLNPVFDRSNTTTNSAISRASSYYLASNPYRWHISEISDPRKYKEYLNVGYAGKFYGGVTTYLSGGEYYIKMLNFMLLYSTDKTGADQYKIMKYCGTDIFAE